MAKKGLYRMLFSVLFCSGLFFSSMSTYAYNIPDNSYYLNVNTSQLGQIVIAIPFNYGKYISFDGNTVVNQYSSIITGYANSSAAGSSVEYLVRFPQFDTPEYRLSSYNQYEDLTITEIYSTTLPNINDSDFTIFSQATLSNMVMCLIGGSIIVLMLKKR